jgi:hypothetical protein
MQTQASGRAAFDSAYRNWKAANDRFIERMDRAYRGQVFDDAQARRDGEELRRLFAELVELSRCWAHWR